jgi:hypothetical protein
MNLRKKVPAALLAVLLGAAAGVAGAAQQKTPAGGKQPSAQSGKPSNRNSVLPSNVRK